MKETYENQENGESQELGPNEEILLTGREPLYSNEEMLRTMEVDAPMLAQIRAGEKEFGVLDLRDLVADREGYRQVGDGRYNSDYLLIDDEFMGGQGRGYKGIGKRPVKVGRGYLTDRFDYPDTVSREHFDLVADDEGLRIINHEPTNPTEVIMGGEKNEISGEKREAVEIGSYAVAERELHGEDESLAMPEIGVFGVFDGAGGMGNGDLASRTAAETVTEYFAMGSEGRDVKAALMKASERVGTQAEGGISTGVLGQVMEKDGEKELHWASVGDSRIYVVRGGYADKLTEDEGYGNVITNKLGKGGEVRQEGVYALRIGDRVVMVSDGVTGDNGEWGQTWVDARGNTRDGELMPDEVLARIVSRAETVEQAADVLVTAATKKDDRTALVFDI